MADPFLIVVPGDDPPQIAGSPQLDRLRSYGEVRVYPTRPATFEEKIDRVRQAQVILNSRGIVTWRRAELESLPRLRCIATCSIGTDMIDLEAARERGIVVSNQPGRTAPVVAEHLFGLMFSLAKRVAFQTAELKAGRWTRATNLLLQGKVLGVVGTGAIGAEMARLGRSLGMEVIAWTFHPDEERARRLGVTFVPLDELLARADVVSLHVRLTEETRHLIGQRELGLMKEGALLLNGARGDVVDLDAVVEALEREHLGGVGLDVFPREPLPADHPILHCPQVALTPHAADQTPEGVELLNEGAVDNVIAFLEGQPKNNVAV
ncbi:MAG: NAD(P)-dependent oxidoreductase [Candidatus Latescibacterota bacterium]|jgi:D-3-phosphoglycerate dehydrogenase